MGAASASTPIDQITSLSPRWRRFHQNNTGTQFPDIDHWALTVGGKALVMVRL